MFRRISLSLLSRALTKSNHGCSASVRQIQSSCENVNTFFSCKNTSPLLSGLVNINYTDPNHNKSLSIKNPGRKSMIDSIFDLPIKPSIVYNDILPVNNIVEEPGNVIEKQAARMIVVRRRKMKRHRLKKLRKRMRFVWAKVRQRREMRKEKAFQAELMSQIRVAEKFNPEVFAAEKIQKANEVLIPTRWKGKLYPDFIINEFIARKQRKADKKLEREQRRKFVDMDPSHYKY